MRLCRNYNRNNLKVVKSMLYITKDAYEFIIKTTKDSPNVETGGILIGQDIKPLTVEVAFASLPGPNAYHSPHKFQRDTEYCKGILQEYYHKFGMDYVGEWHSHVVSLKTVSGGDITTISSIMHDHDYNFNAFACIIACLHNQEVEPIGYICSNEYIYKVDIQIK